MEKEFIPYEQALALKELGFDEPCLANYSIDVIGETVPHFRYNNRISEAFSIDEGVWFNHNLDKEYVCSAPLYQQAFRWFREKYDLDYSIKPVYGEKHYKKHRCNVYSKEQLVQVMKYYFPDNPYFDSREESELECLRKLIEIVK